MKILMIMNITAKVIQQFLNTAIFQKKKKNCSNSTESRTQ